MKADSKPLAYIMMIDLIILVSLIVEHLYFGKALHLDCHNRHPTCGFSESNIQVGLAILELGLVNR